MALVKYNGNNFLYFDFRVRLSPGLNEVSEKDLKQMREHPLFAHRFEEKILEVLNEEKKGKKGKKSAGGKRSEEEMLELIPEIFDADFLKKIVKDDGRPKVVKRAEEQLYHLSIRAEDEEKGTVRAPKLGM
jgi:hypothetical protein